MIQFLTQNLCCLRKEWESYGIRHAVRKEVSHFAVVLLSYLPFFIRTTGRVPCVLVSWVKFGWMLSYAYMESEAFLSVSPVPSKEWFELECSLLDCNVSAGTFTFPAAWPNVAKDPASWSRLSQFTKLGYSLNRSSTFATLTNFLLVSAWP